MSDKQSGSATDPSVQSVVLLPCPFCGGTDLDGPHISEYAGDHYSPSWWLDCECCPCSMEVQGEDVRELVNAWNRRDGDPCRRGCKIKRAVKEMCDSLTGDY